MHKAFTCITIAAALAVAGCGGGSGAGGQPKHKIGGSVTGLTGAGLTLHSSLGDDLAIAADGAFAFPTLATKGTAYEVTIAQLPSAPAQVCTVANGAGTVGDGDVTNVAVTCSVGGAFIGGTVTGLTGSGLVLSDGLGEDLSIAGSGTYRFTKQVAAGSHYDVTVKTKPASPSQTCTASNNPGTVGTGDVVVDLSCTTETFPVQVAVTGLGGSTGLALQDNGADDLTISADGTFPFATKVLSGGAYAVTIKAQPTPYKSCALTGASGTVTNGAVTVAVNCSGAVVQRWEAPATWGGFWTDDGKMLQHAYFTASGGSDTVLHEDKGITWGLQGGTLGAPHRLDLPAGARYGAGPFSAARYQATAGDGGLSPSGDLLVCALVKPDYDDVTTDAGKPIVAKGVFNFGGDVAGGGWALMQRHRYFSFHYESKDSGGTTHTNIVYTPTYFADRGAANAGPLNPSYVAVCGGRSGSSIYVAANSFASSIWPTGVALTGTGPSTLDAGAHPLTIGGYDDGTQHFGGRVYETAVWSEAATPENIQAKLAAIQGLTLNASEPGVITTYSRNREGPYLASDGSYHSTWRHGPRIDPAKGFLFGLQAWNRVSHLSCTTSGGTPVACDDAAAAAGSVVAAGEELDLWTSTGGALAQKDQLEPPGDSERPSAELVTLPPSASLSTPLQAFADAGHTENAGPIHGQIWVRVAATPTGTRTLRVRTSNPKAGATSVHDVDLTKLTAGTWTRVWLKGLTTDGAAGTLFLEAPSSNSGNIQFYAWGVDLTQILGGGDLGSFDPGPVMYDWSTKVGRFGDDPVEQPYYPVDMLELPAVPASTASTGFCLSVDAQPYEGLSWVSPFVYGQGLVTWIDDVHGTAAQIISFGTFKGQQLCFTTTGAPGGACAAAPPAWTAGSKHNLKGCLNDSDHTLRLYADDVQIATEAGAPAAPDMKNGHVVVGNEVDTLFASWASVGSPYPWNGYVSKALVCRDQNSGASQASCQ